MRCKFCSFSADQDNLIRHHKIHHRRPHHWPSNVNKFEFCNPLGTSYKIHKVVAVYWVILNLPAKFRAGLTSIQLGVLGKSVDVKKFGYGKFLEPLIKDLKLLEQGGIFVETLKEVVGVKLFYVCADNLGAHGLPGFQIMAVLLRIVMSADEARRIKLSQMPETVDALVDLIKDKLQLQGDFLLQFEDPDFQNALCNLSDISELPSDRAVLHIKWKRACQLEEDDRSLGSISSLDTASLSSSIGRSSCPSPVTCSSPSYSPSPGSSTPDPGNLRKASEWPSPFVIPTLSHDVELKLRKGNEAYQKTKKGIDVPRDIKMDILDKITQVSFDIKAYPQPHEVESIAMALITKYPCLREVDGNGYDGWLTSIRNKFNNFRTKLRLAGCSEVTLNSKRKAGDDSTQYTLKRAKRGEINHFPEHPNQQNEASLEQQRILLVEASKKAQIDESLVREKMNLTFSLRRREVVEDQPMVIDIQDRWPALFFKDQIEEEFFRITNKTLLVTFRAAVEKYTPKLLRLYRARKAYFGKDMEEILTTLDDENCDILRHRKNAAMRGLPIFLREDSQELFKRCLETDGDDVAIKGMAVGILFVLEDCVAERSSPKVQDIAVVLEERVVLQDISDTPTALAYLFGLLYALNISYPKALKYTFDTLQNVFMEIGSKCTQRVRSLKNKLSL